MLLLCQRWYRMKLIKNSFVHSAMEHCRLKNIQILSHWQSTCLFAGVLARPLGFDEWRDVLNIKHREWKGPNLINSKRNNLSANTTDELADSMVEWGEVKWLNWNWILCDDMKSSQLQTQSYYVLFSLFDIKMLFSIDWRNKLIIDLIRSLSKRDEVWWVSRSYLLKTFLFTIFLNLSTICYFSLKFPPSSTTNQDQLTFSLSEKFRPRKENCDFTRTNCDTDWTVESLFWLKRD